MSQQEDKGNLLRAPILRAVAEPPLLFMVPVPIFGVNIAVAFCVMTSCIVLFEMSPLVGFFALFAGHCVAAAVSARDPHIATKLRAMGKPKPKTLNIVPARRGAKYHP